MTKTDLCFKCSNEDSILCKICGIAKNGGREHFKQKPTTNADRLRAMSDEELAEKGGRPTKMRLTEWCGEHAAIVNHHENYIDKLAAFEDAEEQGLLVRLPCKVGDAVYCLDPYDGIVSGKITMIQQKANGTWKFRVTTDFSRDVTTDAIGKTVFLTRAEAEAALKGGAGD